MSEHQEGSEPPQCEGFSKEITIEKYLIELDVFFWDTKEKRYTTTKKTSVQSCAELWKVSNRTAWQRLNDLENAGYITKINGVGVFLTEKGVEFLEKFKAEIKKDMSYIENDVLKIIDLKIGDLFEEVLHYPFKRSLYISIADILSQNKEIYDMLIENPIETIKIFEKVLNRESIPVHLDNPEFNVRFILPSYLARNIKELSSNDIKKFVCVRGIVVRVSDLLPKVAVGAFQCPTCGEIKKVEQKEEIFLLFPSVCDNCKKKVDFKLLPEESTFIDVRKIEIQEDIGKLECGEEAKKISIWLFDDLARMNIVVGSRILVSGILCIASSREHGSPIFKKYIIANSISYDEKTNTSFKSEEIEKFKDFSKNNVVEILKSLIAPSLVGLDVIKEAIALQFFSSSRIFSDTEGFSVRLNSHIFLIGDPSTGKTHLLLSAKDIAPKGIFVSAESSTGRGLTVSVEEVKTELGKAWEVKAGAMVLASGGGLYLDEIDKASKEVIEEINQAMEIGIISIARAGIVGTYIADPYILAAANPKFGRFVPEKSIVEQIDLPPTLLSRFDLIFPICDVLDEERDRKIAKGVFSFLIKEETKEDIISFVRKYISYARTIEVQIPDEVKSLIEEYYVYMRKISSHDCIQITPRQLQGIIRIAIASARSRLSNVVCVEDVKRAIRLMEYSLSLIAKDIKTGMYDVDKITLGDKEKREKTKTLFCILEKISGKEKKCLKQDFIKECILNGCSEADAMFFIESLKREGRIFEPQEGAIQLNY